MKTHKSDSRYIYEEALVARSNKDTQSLAFIFGFGLDLLVHKYYYSQYPQNNDLKYHLKFCFHLLLVERQDKTAGPSIWTSLKKTSIKLKVPLDKSLKA